MARPLTIDALVADQVAGCVAPGAERLGLEVEAFGVVRPGLHPLGAGTGPRLEAVLDEIAAATGGSLIVDGGVAHGVRVPGWTYTLEPGGQLEFSGPPSETVMGLVEARASYLETLRAVAGRHGLCWLWMGLHPLAAPGQMAQIAKPRYRAMRSYLPTRGDLALRMMHCTATVQVSLDATDPDDQARRLRVLARLSPLVYLLFANSPWMDGRRHGALTARAAIWGRTDPDRCGLPRWLLAPDLRVQDYVERALDVPMFFIFRDGALIDIAGRLTFRQFMSQGLDGVSATIDDFRTHMSTLFYEVRLKRILEVRSADCVPPEAQLALPALLAGLIYDRAALEDLERWVMAWAPDAVLEALADLPVRGFRGRLGRHDAPGLCRDLLALAREGLSRREPAALSQLAPLEERVASERTFADDLVDRLGDDLRRHPADLTEAFLPMTGCAGAAMERGPAAI